MKKIIIAALFLFSQNAIAADLFTPVEQKKMMKLTLENFWGKAIDSQGKPVMPKDDKERETMPISEEQAKYIINKGGESGLADWCAVAWEERFQLILQQLRKHFSNDIQLAYAGVLHGVAQQMIISGMKDESCSKETKEQMASLIKEDVKNLKESLKDK